MDCLHYSVMYYHNSNHSYICYFCILALLEYVINIILKFAANGFRQLIRFSHCQTQLILYRVFYDVWTLLQEVIS
jgi:hypothetical protein